MNPPTAAVQLALLANIAASFMVSTAAAGSIPYTSYQTGAFCQPSRPILTPRTVNELIRIVNQALRSGQTVKALGARHSLTDIICTDGTPVDMRRFRRLSFNPADKTVTAGSGLYMREVYEFMEKHGRGLRVIPAFGGITVGGAIGTGAHGSSIKWSSSVSDQVIGANLVDGLGNLRTIRTNDADDLAALRIHLGLLGVIVNVTLKTVPLYKIRAHNYVAPETILTDGSALAMVANADQIYMYWFPSTGQGAAARGGKVVVANMTIVELARPGNASTTQLIPPTSSSFSTLSTTLIELAQTQNSLAALSLFQAFTENTLVSSFPGFVPVYSEDGVRVQNPATGLYHRMLSTDCGSTGRFQCPWLHGPGGGLTALDSEMAIQLERLPEFVSAAKAILALSPTAFPYLGLVLRFSAESQTLMSRANGRGPHVHVEWFMMKRREPYEKASTGLAGYQAIMQTLLHRFGGRSHWGKSGLWYHSAFVLSLPQSINATAREAFIAKMREFDPKGVFLNKFGRRLLGTGTALDVDPRTKHCALLDNCICSRDADCASAQVCGSLAGFRVCQMRGSPNPTLFSVWFEALIDGLTRVFELIRNVN